MGSARPVIIVLAVVAVGLAATYMYTGYNALESPATPTTASTTPSTAPVTTTTANPATSTTTGALGTTTTTTAGTASPSTGGRGPMGPSGGVEASGNECVELAGAPPGRLINWLFENHDKFSYTLYKYPENLTLVWIITGPSKEYLETLAKHIEQMECIIERGGTPRPNDPLFVVDSKITGEYVNTTIEWVNETAIRITKIAENQCAYRVIELHAEVVKGFFDTGRVEAAKTHEVPEDVAEICKPYLEQQG